MIAFEAMTVMMFSTVVLVQILSRGGRNRHVCLQLLAEAGDTIQDYRPFSGEVLDIADLLSGYDSLSDLITDFVQITDNGVDSYLAVDSDGGADNFVQVAELLGITGLSDEAALETSGSLITA